MPTIPERLKKLTDPEVKVFVTKAVAALKKAPDKKGEQMLAELNKSWAAALNAAKVYPGLLAKAETAVKATVGADLDGDEFSTAEKAIRDCRADWAKQVINVDKFEKTFATAKTHFK